MNKQILITTALALIGIISMSSAVIAFSYITTVGPITKSSWRLQITTFCFLISVLLTSKQNHLKYLSHLQAFYKQILISGLSITGYFCLWNISMQYTSVAHSLLFLYSCPILLVLYYILIRESLKILQIFGALTGLAGLVLMSFMANSSEGSTWYGDLIALSGALTLCINLVVSEAPMKHSPLMYLFSIHFVSTGFCLVLIALIENKDLRYTFAFLYEFQGVYAVYLGVVCGFVGNGAFYLLLQRVNPFVVSVIINFDPVVGSLLAWGFGLLVDPGIFTYVGGSLVVVGNLVATRSGKEAVREESESPGQDSGENKNSSCAIEIKHSGCGCETSQMN